MQGRAKEELRLTAWQICTYRIFTAAWTGSNHHCYAASMKSSKQIISLDYPAKGCMEGEW